MLPIVKRAMISNNKAVFEAGLESMRKIARVFGQDAIDQQAGVLADALEKHRRNGGPGVDARARLVMRTLTAICSEATAASLRTRFDYLSDE